MEKADTMVKKNHLLPADKGPEPELCQIDETREQHMALTLPLVQGQGMGRGPWSCEYLRAGMYS